MSLAECQLVCLKPEDGSDGIAFCPISTKTCITIGSDPKCDIRIYHDDIKKEHFTIYIDAAKKVMRLFTGASPLFSFLFLLFLLFLVFS